MHLKKIRLNTSKRQSAFIALVALATACFSGVTAAHSAALHPTEKPNRGYRLIAACPSAKPTQIARLNTSSPTVRCLAVRRQTIIAGRAVGFGLTTRQASAAINGTAGFGATSLRKAYQIRATGNRSSVIAIIDATHSATAYADLQEYRKTFGLDAMTDCSVRAAIAHAVPSGTKPCFMQLDQTGVASIGLATEDQGWAQETALDLEMASAACPKCSILLVEGATASFENLAQAVETATAFNGVKAISNSYGGGDVDATRFPQYGRAAQIGIAVTASSGDSGFGVESPASFDSVIAVGGTSLKTDPTGRWQSESAWAGSGSGCSSLNPAPSWQLSADTGCPGKATADVAAVADPLTGVSVFYDGGWYVFGGTSASAPFIAGLYALKHDFGGVAADFTARNSFALHDITAGSNASSSAAKQACTVVRWCNAGIGWDAPTGFGTPAGTAAF